MSVGHGAKGQSEERKTREELINEIRSLKTRIATLIEQYDHLRLKETRDKIEDRFRTLVEAINDMVWETDVNFKCTYASPVTKELLGYEVCEVLGKCPINFVPPEETEKLRNTLSYILREHKPFKLLGYSVKRGRTKAGGTGLGLFLVKTLVDSYNGKVWIEDRIQGDYKKGCRFNVLLPAVM